MLMVVRPSAVKLLDPPLRILFLQHTFASFFRIVWVAIALLLGSGLWMLFFVFGGLSAVAWYIHLMLALGLLMMLIFAVLYFLPFRKFSRTVDEQNWSAAVVQLESIRKLVMTNAILGVIVMLAASAGRYI